MNKELRYVDYSGDSIEIYEASDGLVIREPKSTQAVGITSLEDAVALREYLNKLIRQMTVEGSL